MTRAPISGSVPYVGGWVARHADGKVLGRVQSVMKFGAQRPAEESWGPWAGPFTGEADDA